MAQGSETITGTEGNDNIKANGNSDDIIFGLGGNDVINGGAGNDTIDGGEGNDILSGGGGNFADTFVFGANSGVDTVTDFQSGMDVVDLSGTGVSDLTGLVTDNANGDAVIDLGNGNTVTLEGVSSAEFLSDPNNFVLAEPPSIEDVFLGVNDTYVDAGDNTDQRIHGDNAGEGLTDTDLFDFGPGMGNDEITDFQHEDVDFSGGTPVIIPGDTLDLRDYGIVGQDYAGDPVTGAIAAFANLTDITFLDANGNVLNVGDPNVDQLAVTSILHLDDNGDGVADSSLTLLGVDYVELGVVLEFNTALSDGSTLGNA